MQVISREDAKYSNFKRFFTGAACRHGHVAERLASSGQCTVCVYSKNSSYALKNGDRISAKRQIRAKRNASKISEYMAQWRAENSAKIASDKRRDYADHAEERRGQARQSYRLKQEENIARSKRYRNENSTEILEKKQAYYLKNRDHIVLYKSQYASNNRGLMNAQRAKRLTRKMSATPAWADQSAIKKIYVEAASVGAHVDHIIPLQGRLVCGLHVENNLQLLSPFENSSKHNNFDPVTHVEPLIKVM